MTPESADNDILMKLSSVTPERAAVYKGKGATGVVGELVLRAVEHDCVVLAQP